jgi:hypothetical protein
MKKGVTPSNYKDLVQKRLVADIFKTPGQQQQDELSEVQFNNTTRQPFQGAEDETVQLPSQTPVWTSTPVAEDNGILDTASNRPLHFASNYWDNVEDSRVIN